MARRYGPREWTPRAPKAGDFRDTIDEWSEIVGELEDLEQIKTIQHVFYKAGEWLDGSRRKPDRNDLLELNTAISSLIRNLERIVLKIQGEALPPSVDLAKWLTRKIKEEESS